MASDFRWFVMDKDKWYKQNSNIASMAVNFYKQQLSNRNGKILEVGVNEPLLLPFLMESGPHIEEGVACIQKPDTNTATVSYTNLSDLKLTAFNEAIIIPFGHLLTVPERIEAIKALKSCYEHLKPNGMIMIDLFLQDEYQQNQRKVETKNEQGHLFIYESQIVEMDFYEQKAMYLLSIEQWEEGELLLRERKLQSFLWFGIKEFKLVLERIGFTNVKILGDYQQSKGTVNMSLNKIFTFEASKPSKR